LKLLEWRYVRACLRAYGVNLADLDETAARDTFWVLCKTAKLPAKALFAKARMGLKGN
jgi:hypothetical protein